MAVTVEPLGPARVGALKALLSRDPKANMYLLGLMEEFGVVSGADRAPFTFWGRSQDDELTAALFVAGSGGLLVPSASTARHVGEIAQALSGKVTLQSALGETALVDELVKRLGQGKPKLSKTQVLFSVSADDLGPFTNPLLRLAKEVDLEQLVPMAAGCIQDMLGRDPLVEDPEGFPARVKQRVVMKRTYVLQEAGKLVFKLDVGSRSQFGAELEGLYTVPEARRQGHATLCLGQISRFLLSSLPRLTLRVDESNPSLMGVARKVGWVAGRQQKLVIAT